jgi:hypothetical protein
MTWRSKFNTDPPDDEEGYTKWLDAVMGEPWVTALFDLVRWDGVWVGTEEQLIKELKMRVGKVVRESEDFPTTFQQLMDYQGFAIDGFLSSGLGIFDYREEFAAGDLDDFDVPGWGPEAPVLVKEGDAAYRPYYRDVQFELLKYWHPLPVGIFHLTASREFAKSRRKTYTTKDLVKVLVKYFPTYRNVPRIALDFARPEGIDDLFPEFRSDEEFDAMIKLYGPKAHLIFYKQMKKWAPVLKEKARIKVTWVKRRQFPGLPENLDPEGQPKIWWTIEAPRWKNPDQFRGSWAIFNDV